MNDVMKIGLIGFGNIGAGVLRALHENEALIAERSRRPLRISDIADIDTTTKRDAPYDPATLVSDAGLLINSPDVEVIIELVGGIEPARTFVEKALMAGKHVVTANKALMAMHGPELLAVADSQGVGLLFEAAVGGGIPIIRALEQGLCGNSIHSVVGIINGTANYILTQMEERGIGFKTALREAQKAGYAEADPTFDIEGNDTQHKIAILASLAFGMDIRGEDVWVEGIKNIQSVDIRYARQLGYAIKLLGIAKQELAGGAAEVRVHPTLIPGNSQLAAVRGVYNGIQVDGTPIGPTMYYGQGAGPSATASAIISDLMALAADGGKFNAGRDARLRIPIGEKKIRPRDELETNYYLRFEVADRAGAMATLSRLLADSGISIESMIQHKPDVDADEDEPEGATVTIVTHVAMEKRVRNCLKQINQQKVSLAPPFVLRVEE